uniref:Transmembrane protein n=1 Tax=Anopheles minimus TaxID=112268 RepID=A0A182VX61_9DIPT
MCQFGNCTGTDRTATMLLTVSILTLAVLLSEQAPKVFCGPTANDTTAGNHWGRVYGPAILSEDDRFYTLDYSHTTSRPRARASKSGWRREPRFISFETKDNSIEVEVNFAIPFLSIPIQKSMDGVMSSVLKGTPLLNVNLGAVAVAGVLTVGGALVGAAVRTFSNSSTALPWSSLLSLDGLRQSPGRTESKPRQKQEGANQRNEDDDNLLWTLLGSLDRTMEGYDIDTVACIQRTVCWYVKEATIAVAESKATSVDTIVEGLSRADWLSPFISGTAIEQAIQTARKERSSCEKSFPSCAITSFMKHVVRLASKR